MSRSNRDSPTAGERVAQLAVAQYLLFDATVESLSILTDRFVHPRTARALGETQPHALVEPFQSRLALLRRMMDEPTEPPERVNGSAVEREALRAAALATPSARVTPRGSARAARKRKTPSAKVQKKRN